MKTRLPRIGTYILEKAAYYKNRDYILGDTEETFKNISKSENTFKANLWFWSEVIYCLPGFLRNNIYWGIIMFSNYIKIAFRNLVKYKSFSFINLSGLAMGLACSILILLYVTDELSYDRFHSKGESLYRVVKDHIYGGGNILPVAVTPAALGPVLKVEFPEIVDATRIKYFRRTIMKEDNFYSEKLLYADPSFLDMFTIPLIMGDKSEVLNDPFSILLSETLAKKLFGNKNPVEKNLLIDNKLNLQVTGVFKDIPKNSHLQFDAIVPFVLNEEDGLDLNNWGRSAYYTYVRLKHGVAPETVNEKIKDIINKHRDDAEIEVYLQPMFDIHLYSGSKFAADLTGHGDIEYVNIFSLIAIFVVIIACINFMNLSTARSFNRAKEVSLRKVVGGVRSQIIWQFFIESILMALISLMFSLMLVYFLLPEFNGLSGKEIKFWEIDSTILIAFLLIGITTGVLSGSYPAFFLSSFKPAKILKGSYTSGTSGSLLRKVLVVAQFSMSVILIIGTVVVFSQLKFIQNKNLGFQKENIVHVPIDDVIKSNIDVVKQKLLEQPEILSASISHDLPINYGGYGSSGIEWEGKNPEDDIIMNFAKVDEDYLSTFNIKLVQGRFFSKEFSTDSSAVVINETALKMMGLADPLGKKITMWGDELTIIGIVKDIHYKKLDAVSGPLVLRYMSDWSNLLFLKISPNNVNNTIDYVENVLSDLGTQVPFRYTFFDEDIDQLYKSEQRMGKLFTYFSIIAIIISCLGLFGLSSFMAERRAKEIGIRKVLGATSTNLTYLLTSEFTKWVIIANIISWPIAYYFMEEWLQEFAYRIDISFWIFPISCIGTLFIAFATVAYQTIRAANLNPIDSIKYE